MANATAATALWVIVMINIRPQDYERRAMIRSTLALQFAANGTVSVATAAGADIRVRFSHFFAVGRPSARLPEHERHEIKGKLESESNLHGDLAHLTEIDDGADLEASAKRRCPHCLAGDSGKSHHLFAWALARYSGKAHAVVKVDDDTFVDWSRTAPRFFDHLAFPPRNYVFGLLYHKDNGCPAGAIYGFTFDVVAYFATNYAPTAGRFEDIEACAWMKAYDTWTTQGQLNRAGLVSAKENSAEDYWVHGKALKGNAGYLQCATRKGCHGKFNPDFVMGRFTTTSTAASPGK